MVLLFNSLHMAWEPSGQGHNFRLKSGGTNSRGGAGINGEGSPPFQLWGMDELHELSSPAENGFSVI